MLDKLFFLRGKTFEALLLSASFLISISVTAQTNQRTSSTTSSVENIQISAKRYIVELHQAPTVRQLYETALISTKSKNSHSSKPKAKISLFSTQAKSYQTQLAKQHTNFVSSMQQQSPKVKVHKRYTSLFNGFSITAPLADINKVKQMPGVKRVYPDLTRYVHLDTSHKIINTESVWQNLGGQESAGAGLKIAIIDSGIRNENPMFSDQGMQPIDLSNNEYLTKNPDYCRAANGDASFCNNKIIVARWIDPNEHELFNLDPNEYMSPLGLNRHGSHVAGIAAGKPVSIEYTGVPVTISGVAPSSYLMIYKALYSSHGSTFGTDSMLLEALEHAVNDGADIINNSWGSFSAEQPESSIYADIFANAEALGITIVNSAGNIGLFSDKGSINCPGCIESGITVGNTMHGRFFGHKLRLPNDQTYIALQGEELEDDSSPLPPFAQDPHPTPLPEEGPTSSGLTEDLSLTLRAFSELGASSSGGCEYSFDFPTFENAAILVDYRDDCNMEQVVENAKAASGSAVIVYQSAISDISAKSPFEPYHRNYELPVLGVSRATGLALFESIGREFPSIDIEAHASSFVDPVFSDAINISSSRGPNNNPHVLKPDVAAPGTFILSASAPPAPSTGNPFEPIPTEVDNSPRYTIISGTSMSSPHVAGAVALIKQQHPEWSTSQIKSAIISTANTNIKVFKQQANAFSIGGGRIDIAAAIEAKLAFSKASFADPACIGRCNTSHLIENLTDTQSQWQVRVEFEHPDITTIISQQHITLAAKGSAQDSQQLELEFNTSNVPESAWLFGQLILDDGNGYTQHIPLAVYANDNTDSQAISTSADLSNDSTQIPITVKIRNIQLNDDPTVKINVPSNASIIQQSESVTLFNAQTDSLTVNPDANQITWSGQIAAGQMQLVTDTPWFNESLTELGIEPVPCSDNCNLFNKTVDFNFDYYGQNYSSIAISSNGFAVPGTTDISSFSVSPNTFPHQDNLNNIIAPMWADYDYKDPENPFATGGGHLRTAIRNINGSNYLIAEWDQVQIFDFDEQESESESESEKITDTYSFQLIIEEHTDNIWFNYLSIPSIPSSASIGAENADALVGVNYYYRGEGNNLPLPLPAQGYRLKLEADLIGEAKIQFLLALTNGQDSTSADQRVLNEDTPITLDVLSNDTGDANIKLDAELQAGETYHASRLIKLRNHSMLDPDSLTITTMPEHGLAEVKDGKIDYQPNDNFYGQDNLQYQVTNSHGNLSKPTPVTLTVLAKNDPPEITVETNVSVFEGAEAVLTVDATDADNDNLTYQWQQTSGLIVATTTSNNTISFTAPIVSRDRIISFDVNVSDGQENSESQTIQILIVDKPNGGSLGWLALILIGLLGCYRINARYKSSR